MIDTSLKNLPGGGDANAFEEWFLLVTSGSASELKVGVDIC